jgi:hypothetical protein
VESSQVIARCSADDCEVNGDRQYDLQFDFVIQIRQSSGLDEKSEQTQHHKDRERDNVEPTAFEMKAKKRSNKCGDRYNAKNPKRSTEFPQRFP